MTNLRTALIFTIGLACVLCAAGARADSGALNRAAGLADKESRKPMQVDALFCLSCVSKPVVTVPALALVDRKQLSLDDPVTKWLPRMQEVRRDSGTASGAGIR